ncbi:MAG TPA: hypothetical protein VD927_17720, partial [Chryseosolibacter sp.]|nr:hypothetical protein [Chryseosolibacter sp.]
RPEVRHVERSETSAFTQLIVQGCIFCASASWWQNLYENQNKKKHWFLRAAARGPAANEGPRGYEMQSTRMIFLVVNTNHMGLRLEPKV